MSLKIKGRETRRIVRTAEDPVHRQVLVVEPDKSPDKKKAKNSARLKKLKKKVKQRRELERFVQDQRRRLEAKKPPEKAALPKQIKDSLAENFRAIDEG